jgi:hypothetical protein
MSRFDDDLLSAPKDAKVFELEDPAVHVDALGPSPAHLFDPGGRSRPQAPGERAPA